MARAAAAGASREKLLREVLKALSSEGNADRIGIWIELEANSNQRSESPGGFQGVVWDRENPQAPKEWTHLSVEAPLPEDLLLEGKSAEQDLEASPDRPIIGPLVELRRALWVPIQRMGRLRGVILAGSRTKQLPLPRDHVESVAAELALAIQLEEERRLAHFWHVDLNLARSFLKTQDGAAPLEVLLSNLVTSCTATTENETGVGAAFAVIGVSVKQGKKSGSGPTVEFHWRSGDETWTRGIESEPLASV